MSRARTVATLACIVALAPIVLVALVGNRPASLTAGQHFGLVGGAAALTSLASLLLSLAGARARDGRAILMGTAFSTMTALFALHGLATPGFIVGPNGVIALAGGLSIPVGAYLLALTAAAPLRRRRNVAPLLILQAALFAGVLALGAVALIDPSIVPPVPKVKSAPAIGLLIAGLMSLTLLVTGCKSADQQHGRAARQVALIIHQDIQPHRFEPTQTGHSWFD